MNSASCRFRWLQLRLQPGNQLVFFFGFQPSLPAHCRPGSPQQWIWKPSWKNNRAQGGWGTICPTPPHPGAVLRPVRLHGSSGQGTFSWCGQGTTSFGLRWSSESTHKYESPSSIPSTQPGLHRRLWALWSLPSGTTLGFVSVVKAFFAQLWTVSKVKGFCPLIC